MKEKLNEEEKKVKIKEMKRERGIRMKGNIL